MAKSIFEILSDMQTETTVPFMGTDKDGKTILVPHTIPEDLFPTDLEFEDPELLLSWAEENNHTFALLQRGIAKTLIEVRAIFKAPKKGKDKSPDTWTPEMGQANVNKMEFTHMKRPNQSNNGQAVAKAVLAETVANMQLMIDAAGLTEEKIADVLLEKFNQETDIVTSILDALTFPEA